MKKIRSEVAVIGDGGWGTTLALVLRRKGVGVSVWGAFPDYVKLLQRSRVNARYLPGVRIPAGVRFSADLNDTLAGARTVVLAVPSQYLRSVLSRIRAAGFQREARFVSVSKGLELGSLKRMSQVIHEELGGVSLAVLSGPTIAHELALGKPTTAVLASASGSLRHELQALFMSETFRIYTSSDVIGVELGGSVKNVIAIACGISDGLGFGTNAKAALLSRGIAEISRLGVVLGARACTFSGLSGLGDLVTTCISPFSRNRFVGEEIGKGKSLSRILASMRMIAEGVSTARSAHDLSLRHGVEMPITSAVYQVLYRRKSAISAVRELMGRQRKAE